MAWFYSLAVECGDRDAASACAQHFADADADVSAQQSSEDGAWWAVVTPRVADGLAGAELAQARTAAGQALLERLRSAPPFRFAVIGVEAFESATLDGLDASEGSDPSFPQRFHGLVVSDAVRGSLGPDAPLEPFAPGYSWFPYRGER